MYAMQSQNQTSYSPVEMFSFIETTQSGEKKKIFLIVEYY